MKKIGEGFYYKVYDLGNGRVLKKETSYLSRMAKLIAWGAITGIETKDMLSRKKLSKKFEASLTKSKETLGRIPNELLGNPVFKGGYEYEQDRATILEKLIGKISNEEFLELMKKYINFQKTLWSYGLSDTVFNFTINAGVSAKTGGLICIDFNEFSDSKEKVTKCIEKKKWITQKSLRDFPKKHKDLKEKIIDLFDQEFTMEELNKVWK